MQDKTILSKKENEILDKVNALDWLQWQVSKSDFREDNEGEKFWYINPSPQELLNFGSYTIDDFELLLDGKGPIVKGKTDDEKEKYFKALTFYRDYGQSLTFYAKSFHLFNECETLVEDYDRTLHLVFKNPVNKDKHPKAIMQILYYNWALYICRELDASWIDPLVDFKDLKNKERVVFENWRNERYGVQKTLRALDIGYFGACNQEDAENHGFMQDLAFYYGYYMYLQQHGVEMPDFEMINKNYFKTLK